MSSSQNLKALVVEDQELFRQAVADELSFFGFTTITAKDGEEGLKAAMSTNFDLILSDMRMPNRDGRWFLYELRKSQKCAPPFVFMTGFSDLSPQDAYEMGADGFLGKPLNSDRLAALLARVCRPLETRWIELPQATPVNRLVMKYASWGTQETQSKIALGRGGMFIAMDKIIHKPGDLVAFEIEFADGPLKRLEGIGVIVWRREHDDAVPTPGYGIDFEYITASTLPNWLSYLRSREIVPVIPRGCLRSQDSNIIGLD